MRKEFWTFLGCGVFFLIVAPVYWALSHEVTGTVALVMAMLSQRRSRCGQRIGSTVKSSTVPAN